MTMATAPPATPADIAALLNQQERANRQRRIEHIIEQGRLLLAAKKLVGYGHWTQWCRDCLIISPRMCTNYMQAYKVLRKSTLSEADQWREWQRIQSNSKKRRQQPEPQDEAVPSPSTVFAEATRPHIEPPQPSGPIKQHSHRTIEGDAITEEMRQAAEEQISKLVGDCTYHGSTSLPKHLQPHKQLDEQRKLRREIVRAIWPHPIERLRQVKQLLERHGLYTQQTKKGA